VKGGSKVVVEPHRHEGVFIARGKEDALVTLNSTPVRHPCVHGPRVDSPLTQAVP